MHETAKNPQGNLENIVGARAALRLTHSPSEKRSRAWKVRQMVV